MSYLGIKEQNTLHFCIEIDNTGMMEADVQEESQQPDKPIVDKDYSYVQNQLSKTHLRHQVRLCTLI